METKEKLKEVAFFVVSQYFAIIRKCMIQFPWDVGNRITLPLDVILISLSPFPVTMNVSTSSPSSHIFLWESKNHFAITPFWMIKLLVATYIGWGENSLWYRSSRLIWWGRTSYDIRVATYNRWKRASFNIEAAAFLPLTENHFKIRVAVSIS